MRILLLALIISLTGCSQSLDPKMAAILDHNFTLLDKRLSTLENANSTLQTSPASELNKQPKK